MTVSKLLVASFTILFVISAVRSDAVAGEPEPSDLSLRSELQALRSKISILEARASDAEKKVQELNLKLKNVERAWFPAWFTSHTSHVQELAATNWNEYAKPTLTILLQKASVKSGQVQKWAVAHLHDANTKWLPAAKEQLVIFKTNVEPYCQQIVARGCEVYEASFSVVEPYVFRVQEAVDPYIQQAKNASKPYIDQVVHVSKPHFEKGQELLVPYTEHIVRTSGKILKTARTYHNQVQASIHEELKKHELTKSHATKELAWFMASTLFAFPMFFLYKMLLAVFCKNARNAKHNAHSSQKPRRHKRRHGDK